MSPVFGSMLSSKVLNLNLFLLQTLKKVVSSVVTTFFQWMHSNVLLLCFDCVSQNANRNQSSGHGFGGWYQRLVIIFRRTEKALKDPTTSNTTNVLIQNTNLLTVWNLSLSLQIVPGRPVIALCCSVFEVRRWWRTPSSTNLSRKSLKCSVNTASARSIPQSADPRKQKRRTFFSLSILYWFIIS